MRRTWLALAAAVAAIAAGAATPAWAQNGDAAARTPITHVILLFGENRSFDHLFGTFRPPPGEHVRNLLSEGILGADGRPGPNFAGAAQWQASDTGRYSIHPQRTAPYATLPPPSTAEAPTRPPFASVAAAQAAEPALPVDAYRLLTIGGTGLPRWATDTRFPAALPNGPFVITRSVGFDAYTGDPVHRFFQMWQQLDCDAAAATPRNPSGCRADLFPWVAISAGSGHSGRPPPPSGAAAENAQGGVAMGVYDSASGDAPYLTRLAREYALSDNYHQRSSAAAAPTISPSPMAARSSMPAATAVPRRRRSTRSRIPTRCRKPTTGTSRMAPAAAPMSPARTRRSPVSPRSATT